MSAHKRLSPADAAAWQGFTAPTQTPPGQLPAMPFPSPPPGTAAARRANGEVTRSDALRALQNLIGQRQLAGAGKQNPPRKRISNIQRIIMKRHQQNLPPNRYRDNAAIGLRVFPVLPRDKKPAGAWRGYQTEAPSAERRGARGLGPVRLQRRRGHWRLERHRRGRPVPFRATVTSNFTNRRRGAQPAVHINSGNL
jgi:hypothetical protein